MTVRMSKLDSTRASNDSLLVTYWSCDQQSLLYELSTSESGLTQTEAASRLLTAAPQVGIRRNQPLKLFLRQFTSPIILILLAAAALSMAFDETTDSVIIVLIVTLSGALSFVQERGAVRALESLLHSIAIHADILRNGEQHQVLIAEVVPGDIVVLRAGDMIPGDCRVLSANQLRINEAPLTGENYPRHKEPGVLAPHTEPTERSNCLYFGTHVSSGEGSAVVVRTGTSTEFGAVTEHVTRQHLPTSFERGVTQFGYFLMRVTGVLVVALFVFNMALSRPIAESLLFSLALAVGLTPQMLPAIVTLSLSRGAAAMARKRVIVRRLDAIEDIGGLDVLCTDKTGTLTVGSVGLHSAVDIHGSADEQVLRLSWLNARLQSGYKNPIDDAILASTSFVDIPTMKGELPFDFTRRRQSICVQQDDSLLLITKGAVEPLLQVCSMARLDEGTHVPVEEALALIFETFHTLSKEGLRVIGVASRNLSTADTLDPNDEQEMTFVGFLTFADPPKPGTQANLERLRNLGVRVVLVTGDNRLSATYTAEKVGINVNRLVTGADVAKLNDHDLLLIVETTNVFCEVDPLQKEHIVRALSRAGHTVGFLGDGINDTPALHGSDVGISVDTAVDIAKQTADLVLLDKDLAVLADGVEYGRRIFSNTLKYVQVTTSANFGNMLSLAITTTFLPFLPLLPLQILLLNFMSDVPGLTIATDRVDDEQIVNPQRWDIAYVKRFMIVFGLASTAFDLVTFAILRYAFDANETELRSGWFVLSTLTELAAMLILRTRRPFFKSKPGTALLISSGVVGMATVALPYSPLAQPFGLAGPSMATVASLAAVLIGYVTVSELLKLRAAGRWHQRTSQA